MGNPSGTLRAVVGWHRLEKRVAVLFIADTQSSRGESGRPPTRPKPQEGPNSGSGSMRGCGSQGIPGMAREGRQHRSGPLQ